MSFVIIPGRNSSYPCHSELPELTALEYLSMPYPYSIYTEHPEVEHGYPYLNGLPELCSIRQFSEPYPLGLFTADGGANEGYPLPEGLPVLGGVTYSKLICSGRAVREMRFNEKPVEAAYFGGETVFIRI